MIIIDMFDHLGEALAITLIAIANVLIGYPLMLFVWGRRLLWGDVSLTGRSTLERLLFSGSVVVGSLPSWWMVVPRRWTETPLGSWLMSVTPVACIIGFILLSASAIMGYRKLDSNGMLFKIGQYFLLLFCAWCLFTFFTEHKF